MVDALDRSTIDQLKALMKENFSTLVDTYCGNAEKYMSAIEAGFGEGVAEKIRDSAHPLKGSSGNLGLVALHDAAETLELAAKNIVDGEGTLEALKPHIELVKRLCVEGVEILRKEV